MKSKSKGKDRFLDSDSYVSFPHSIRKPRNIKLSDRFDLLGNIAIIDSDGTKQRENRLARHILETHKMVKTVLAKASAVKGRYRKRDFRYISGERNFVATYKENGCTFVFDVRKTFFSNRLSFERNRISTLVKDRENVIVMFAGIGPFAIEIAKRRKNANIVAIEMNRFAYKYMMENIKLNKVCNIEPVLGDVKKISNKYKNFADRVIAPMPTAGLSFLNYFIIASRKKATIHLYTFCDRDNGIRESKRIIMNHAKKKNYKARILKIREVRKYSARDIEICIDLSIKKSN